MLEIQKELDQFILTIKNTQVYKEYQLQKSKVKENPDLKRQLDQFRMRNYELQTKHCPDNLYDEMDCFQREYEQFREIPLVHDFLAAELALCRLVQEVSDGVMRAVAEDFERCQGQKSKTTMCLHRSGFMTCCPARA